VVSLTNRKKIKIRGIDMKTKGEELFDAIMQNLRDNGNVSGMSYNATKHIKEYKEILSSTWTDRYSDVKLSDKRVKLIQSKLYELVVNDLI
jgi:hypothetical protein